MNESFRARPSCRVHLSGLFLTGVVFLLLQACGGGGGREVTSVLVSPGTSEIGPDMTVQLSATALDDSGNVVNGVTFDWQSADSAIASVNASGLVTGIAPGSTAVTASAGRVRSTGAELVVLPPTAVTGTAAIGSPLGGAEVILKDRRGRAVTGRTEADGTFSISTTTLMPPYLLQVKSADGATVLYSASNTGQAGGLINVTPLTDLIVRSWYRLEGADPKAGFDGAAVGSWPTPESVELIGGLYTTSLAIWLERAGVDSNTFNAVSTAFAANGAGADRVLDVLTIHGNGEQLTLKEAGIEQQVTFNHDVANGRIVATTAITSASGTSGAVLQTLVPRSDLQQQATQAIGAQVQKLGETISARGNSLTANDLLPFLSPTLLHDGLDQGEYAAILATAERGRSTSCRLAQVDSLTGAPLIADVVVRCVSVSGETSQKTDRLYRFSDGGQAGWRIEGNRRVARLSVSTELQHMQGASAAGTALRIAAAATAPVGSVVDGRVLGTGMAEGGTALAPGMAPVLQVAPEPESVLNIERERFLATSTAPMDSLTAQLLYEFHLTSAAGEAVKYTVSGGAYTTEPVSVVNLAGTALSDAALGHPLEVEWTLPTTFAVAGVQLEAYVFVSADPSSTTPDCVVAGPSLSRSATSAVITIPATCNGSAVARVQLNVIVTGASGERTVAVYAFQRVPEEFIPAAMDLPIVRIVTQNEAPIVSKDDYVRATLTIDPNGTGEAAVSVPLRIRGRGNSTWAMPKKPYKLKLDDKASFLGMPSDKDWVLLANYSDKSLLRTRVAFELGDRVGLPWSPRSRFVELFINDQYQGTYQLGEGVKVAKKRVDIPEPDEDEISEPEITGGYLLEVDARLDGDVFFFTNVGLPILIDTPEAPAPEQYEYIRDYVLRTENAIYAPDFADPETGYAHYVDVDSFVHWYLVNEIFKNNDAAFYSSCWMYKQRDGKLFMGPLWDFDIGAGNVNYNGNDNPIGWYIRDSLWISRLFEDPAFEARVKTRWNELKASQFDTILDFIDESATSLALASSNNFERWPILDQYVWPNAVVTGSYEGEVQYLRDWLETRIAWMDAQFNP